MYVICKSCGERISVAGRPRGSTGASGVQLEGDVRLGDGGIGFGPGGKVSFGPGGRLSFGKPQSSNFACLECGHLAEYSPEEILDD